MEGGENLQFRKHSGLESAFGMISMSIFKTVG